MGDTPQNGIALSWEENDPPKIKFYKPGWVLSLQNFKLCCPGRVMTPSEFKLPDAGRVMLPKNSYCPPKFKLHHTGRAIFLKKSSCIILGGWEAPQKSNLVVLGG